MKKLTKILLATAFALSSFNSVKAEELKAPEIPGLPPTSEWKFIGERNVFYENWAGLERDYDINKDGKSDIGLIYLYVEHKGELYTSKYPLIYGIDLNSDGEVDLHEMFIDPTADGWNGNEENLYEEMLKEESEKQKNRYF